MTRSGCGAIRADASVQLRGTWFDSTPTTFVGVALWRAPFHWDYPNGRPGSTPGPYNFSRGSSRNGAAGSVLRRAYDVATSGIQDERRWRLIGFARQVLPTWMQVQSLPAGLQQPRSPSVQHGAKSQDAAMTMTCTADGRGADWRSTGKRARKDRSGQIVVRVHARLSKIRGLLQTWNAAPFVSSSVQLTNNPTWAIGPEPSWITTKVIHSRQQVKKLVRERNIGKLLLTRSSHGYKLGS